MNQSDVTTDDGNLSYQLHDGEGLNGHPAGTIFAIRGSILGDGWDYHSAPILMAFRPLKTSLQGVDPGSSDPECGRALISGIPVKVFSSDYFDYALDPAREHVVVRLEYFTKDNSASRRLLIRMDVDYRDGPALGAIPKSWTITRLTEGADLQWSIAGVMEHAEFGTEVHDNDFVVAFPPGSMVRDQVSDC